MTLETHSGAFRLNHFAVVNGWSGLIFLTTLVLFACLWPLGRLDKGLQSIITCKLVFGPSDLYLWGSDQISGTHNVLMTEGIHNRSGRLCVGNGEAERNRWPMEWRHDRKQTVVSRNSSFGSCQSSLPRVFILDPVGSQHPVHKRTKTSWKSRNLFNQ
jgi:hypothetical protein